MGKSDASGKCYENTSTVFPGQNQFILTVLGALAELAIILP